jgi:hypothetical protein
MNPLFSKPKIPQNNGGMNFGQMSNQIVGFVKEQIAKGLSPEQVKQQIFERNQQLKGMIEGEYGNMSYQEIAKRNGYDVQNDLSQLGL